MLCCGKERSTNFCPQCGKPMNLEAGLLGLKNHVDKMFAQAEKKEKEAKEAYELKFDELKRCPNNEFQQRRVSEAKAKLTKATKEREKVQSWQEALIKAIDGD